MNGSRAKSTTGHSFNGHGTGQSRDAVSYTNISSVAVQSAGQYAPTAIRNYPQPHVTHPQNLSQPSPSSTPPTEQHKIYQNMAAQNMELQNYGGRHINNVHQIVPNRYATIPNPFQYFPQGQRYVAYYHQSAAPPLTNSGIQLRTHMPRPYHPSNPAFRSVAQTSAYIMQPSQNLAPTPQPNNAALVSAAQAVAATAPPHLMNIAPSQLNSSLQSTDSSQQLHQQQQLLHQQWLPPSREKNPKKKRLHAIAIINPVTGENVINPDTGNEIGEADEAQERNTNLVPPIILPVDQQHDTKYLSSRKPIDHTMTADASSISSVTYSSNVENVLCQKNGPSAQESDYNKQQNEWNDNNNLSYDNNGNVPINNENNEIPPHTAPATTATNIAQDFTKQPNSNNEIICTPTATDTLSADAAVFHSKHFPNIPPPSSSPIPPLIDQQQNSSLNKDVGSDEILITPLPSVIPSSIDTTEDSCSTNVTKDTKPKSSSRIIIDDNSNKIINSSIAQLSSEINNELKTPASLNVPVQPAMPSVPHPVSQNSTVPSSTSSSAVESSQSTTMVPTTMKPRSQHPLKTSSVVIDGNSSAPTHLKPFPSKPLHSAVTTTADKVNQNIISSLNKEEKSKSGGKKSSNISNNENIPINPMDRPIPKSKLKNIDSKNQQTSNVPAKQTNGETTFETIAVPVAEAKSKKKKANKKDVNKKGYEKEGSDMDAITDKPMPTEEKILNTDKKQQAGGAGQRTSNNTNQILKPNSSQKNLTKSKVPRDDVSRDSSSVKNDDTKAPESTKQIEKLKNQRPERAENQRANSKSARDLESKEPPQSQKEIVASKSLQSNNIPSSTTAVVVEKPVAPQPETKKTDITIPPPFMSGPRRYTLEFLFQLKTSPLSNKEVRIPQQLRHCISRLPAAVNRSHSQSADGWGGSNAFTSFVPQFMASNGSMGGHGSISARRSQQGMSKHRTPPVQVLSIAKDDVQLRTTKNAWKPDKLSMAPKDLSIEEKRTRELNKAVTSILNKLTPQNFDKLTDKIKNLPIDTLDRLKGVIQLIFEKAIDEPGFCRAYAEMCNVVQSSLTEFINPETGKPASFRIVLINRCQEEFESNSKDCIDAEKRLKEINECRDSEKKKELQLLFEEAERKIRRRSVGNCRFIGELFKLRLLTPKIMLNCIAELLKQIDEESLECLCKLLSTIGKDLEEKLGKIELEQYFKQMKDLSVKKNAKISSRIRFMLQDVIDLRQNRWIPRRDENSPKTMEQINQEIEMKEAESRMLIMASKKPMQQQGGFRDQDNRRGRGMNSRSADADGWQSVPMRGNQFYKPATSYALDSKKFQNLAETTQQQPEFGSANKFSKWGLGASAAKNVPPRFGGGLTTSQHERASPQQMNAPNTNARPNRITPSSSIEGSNYLAATKDVGEPEKITRPSSSQNAQLPMREPSSAKQTPKPVTPEVAPASTPSSVPAAKPEPVTAEVIERMSKNILDEFVVNNNLEESVSCAVETIDDLHKDKFVQTLFEYILEKDHLYREKCGILLGALMVKNFISYAKIVDVLAFFISIADDMLLDYPNFWMYLAEIIVRILNTNCFTFDHLRVACEAIFRTKSDEDFLAAILIKGKQVLGPLGIQGKWSQSNLKLTDFIDPANEALFIKSHSLDYLFIPIEPSLKSQILNCLDNPEQLDVIAKRMGAAELERKTHNDFLIFINAITTAIIESSLIKNNQDMDPKLMEKYEILLRKYTENEEVFELKCLDAVQILMNRLQYPKGLLLRIFEKLFDDKIISTEGFLKWKEDRGGDGKGVAVSSLASFFAYLGEVGENIDS